MRALTTLLAIIVLLAVAALVFVFIGAYNVAATQHDSEATRWFLHTVMEQSVRRHAAGIQAPALDSPALLDTGVHHYDEMCVTCHGAPGEDPSEIGKGLNPQPPDLAKEVDEWTPAELFWIVKNGVRMTGMPAWGPTHSDEEIWGMVAFLKRLPELSPQQYQAMVKAAAERHPDDHEHGGDHENGGGHEHGGAEHAGGQGEHPH